MLLLCEKATDTILYAMTGDYLDKPEVLEKICSDVLSNMSADDVAIRIIDDDPLITAGGKHDGTGYTKPPLPPINPDDVKRDELRTKADAGTLDSDDMKEALRLLLK